MKIIILEGVRLIERETSHQYLQEQLEFPPYYGRNLDALYDCLTELKDLLLQIDLPKEDSPYFQKILHVFQLAAKENPRISLLLKEHTD